jgi:hypothetical protein
MSVYVLRSTWALTAAADWPCFYKYPGQSTQTLSMFQGRPEHLSQQLIGLKEKYSPQTETLTCNLQKQRSKLWITQIKIIRTKIQYKIKVPHKSRKQTYKSLAVCTTYISIQLNRQKRKAHMWKQKQWWSCS